MLCLEVPNTMNRNGFFFEGRQIYNSEYNIELGDGGRHDVYGLVLHRMAGCFFEEPGIIPNISSLVGWDDYSKPPTSISFQTRCTRCLSTSISSKSLIGNVCTVRHFSGPHLESAQRSKSLGLNSRSCA